MKIFKNAIAITFGIDVDTDPGFWFGFWIGIAAIIAFTLFLILPMIFPYLPAYVGWEIELLQHYGGPTIGSV